MFNSKSYAKSGLQSKSFDIGEGWRLIFSCFNHLYFFCLISQVLSRQQNEGLNFDADLSSEVYGRYTDFIFKNVWNHGKSLSSWFPKIEEKEERLLRLEEVSDRTSVRSEFSLTFSNGRSFQSHFGEEAFFSSFYQDEEVSYLVPTVK